MNTLLKLIPLEKLILHILLYLRGITRDQWKFALATCADLAEKKLENSERWASAKGLLHAFGMKDSPAVNYLIETAVSYIMKGLNK